MGGRGFVEREVRCPALNTSAMGDPTGDRWCSAGSGGTGGANASKSDGDAYVGVDGPWSEASVFCR
jgi:hypothetical protein